MPLLDSVGPSLLVGVCVVLGILLLPYVLGPVFVYFATKMTARPELEEFYLEDPDVPRLVLDYVDDTLGELERDGFAVLGAYYLGTLFTNARSFLILVGKRPTRDLALIAVTYVEGAVGRLQKTFVEFSAVFPDGGELDVNNTDDLSAFPAPPGDATYSFPWVRDVRRLYRIHQALVERDRPGERAWPVGDDPLAYLEDSLAGSLARQVPNGCLRRSGPNHYRLTIMTALRITYQNLWPFNWLVKARRRRRGEALLRELRV